MMREVLERRMAKGVDADNLPDLLMLDGGKGQLQVAVDVLAHFDLLHQVDLVAIAKEKAEEGRNFPAGPQEPHPSARPFAGVALFDAYPRRGPPLRHHLSP